MSCFFLLRNYIKASPLHCTYNMFDWAVRELWRHFSQCQCLYSYCFLALSGRTAERFLTQQHWFQSNFTRRMKYRGTVAMGHRGPVGWPGHQAVCPLQSGGIQLEQRGDVVAVAHRHQAEGDLLPSLPLLLRENTVRLHLPQHQNTHLGIEGTHSRYARYDLQISDEIIMWKRIMRLGWDEILLLLVWD